MDIPPSTPPHREQAIATLADWLAASSRGIAFTGAGVSTASGIPDFRSPNGLWTRYQPVFFDDFLRSQEARRQCWRMHLELGAAMGDIKPNGSHAALATLINLGILSHVITQNVDGLHQAAGVAEERVIELHGNAGYAVCLDCQKRHELEPIKIRFMQDETPPVCLDCGGPLKVATISFGQPMPEAAMTQATALARNCDLCLVLGSSLVVYPAAGIPMLAKTNGARLVIINREPTDQDHMADLVIHDDLGPVMEAALARLTATRQA